MPSVKLFTGSVLAGALASVLAIPTAAAQTAGPVSVMVNDEAPLTVPPSPGFSYVAGAPTTLSVTSDGYLLCANVYLPGVAWTTTTLAPGHPDWSLPAANDVRSITYTSGALSINKPALGSFVPSLVCHARVAQGTIANPFSAFGDEIFGDSYESVSVLATQYGNMVNWALAPGFSWDQAVWSQVPNDACNFYRSANTPRVSEQNLCTAATGVRPSIATPPPQPYGDRAPTMWTGSFYDSVVGWSFIYLARVDVRIGAPTEAPNSGFHVGPLTPAQPADLSNSVTTEIRDGFDSTILSPNGTWCFLNSLPTTLDANVCANPARTGPLNGTLAEDVPVSLFPGVSKTSFFVAVIRPLLSNPPVNNTPVAAVSVMADPTTVRYDYGDGFVGDDVIFGFIPGSTGFPWMQ